MRESPLVEVPFAVARAAAWIHISRLSRRIPVIFEKFDVSLLIAEQKAGENAQMLARVTLQGRARLIDRDGKNYAQARADYAERFPDAAALFEYSDFSLFAIRPLSARVIAGFGQAVTISAEEFKSAISI